MVICKSGVAGANLATMLVFGVLGTTYPSPRFEIAFWLLLFTAWTALWTYWAILGRRFVLWKVFVLITGYAVLLSIFRYSGLWLRYLAS